MAKVNYILLILLMLLVSTLACADYVTVQTYGAPFDINESIPLYGAMDTINSDLNIYIRNTAGTDVNQIYVGNRSSSYSTSLRVGTAGDYNVTVVDLNHNVSASMAIRVTNIARVSINWDNSSMKPPFSTTQGGNNLLVTFTAYRADDTNMGSNADINVELYNSAGALQDSNVGSTNGDGNVQLTFTLPSAAGDYYFSINKGIAAFHFPVFSFKTMPSIKDPDTNNFQDTFKPGDTAELAVEVKNYAGTQYITTATVTGRIYDSSGSAVSGLSNLTLTGSGGRYSTTFTVPSTQGAYYASMTTTYADTNQIQRISFRVENYKMTFFAAKYEGGGMGEKEKMPSIYPTSTMIAMEAHIIDLNTEVGELSGSSLNYICNNDNNIWDHNFMIKYRLMGRKDWNSMLGEADINSTKSDTYCTIRFSGPATAGVWEVRLEADDLNVLGSNIDLSADTIIVVQNYFVFLEPVDPTSCDASQSDVAESCGFRFSFTKGQKIGLKPTIIDMKNANSVTVLTRVRGAIIFGQSGETRLTAGTDIDLNADLNLLIIDTNSSTFNSISGGFYHGGFFVDVNASGTLVQSNVTAFGFFNMRALNATLSFVDINGTDISSHGFPTYSNDYNTYLKVTVLDTDGSTAIQGAKVSVGRLMNFEAWTDYNTGSIDANYTNSSGIATLVIDKDALSLTSGQYELTIDINAPSVGKTDSLQGMFERRSFFAIANLYDTAKCMPKMMIPGDGNMTFIVEASNPFGWEGLSDINLTNAVVYYEGSVTKPLDMPKQMSVTLDINNTVTCNDTNYSAIDVNHNARWESGFYRAVITAVSASRGTQTINAFFKVQPFSILVIPNRANITKASSYAEPGAQWDFNITSTTDVNITAKLINVESWTVFANDVNMHKAGGHWLNRPDYNSTDVNGDGTWQTIDVNIPSNLPLAKELDRGGYVLQIDANSNDGNVASAELFIIPMKWRLFAAKEIQGMWSRGMPGPYSFTATGSSATMYVDSNVVNDCNAAALATYGRSHRIEDINTAGLTYDRIIKPAGSGYGTATDFNRFVLVNTTTRRVYVDYEDDCNWADAKSLAALPIGGYAHGITTVRSYESCGPGGCSNAANPYDGTPIITSISRNKLSYITKHIVDDLNSASVTNFDPFMGEVETDTNIGIPVIVKNLSNTGVGGLNVSIYTVMKAEMGGGTPITLAASDYNKFTATTDGNGVAVPIVAFKDSGIYIIGLQLTDGTTTQTIMPWNGVAVKAGGFSPTVTFALEDINISYDTNIITRFPLMDINRDVIPLTCFDGNSTLIGFLDEDINSINLDNDVVYVNNDYNSLMMDENWFFIPLNGSCLNGVHLIIDDDYKISPNIDDSNEAHPKGAVNYNQDLNEVVARSAADFTTSGLCLYGSGRCSGTGGNINFGGLYDLTPADANVIDGNLFIFNYFTNEKFFAPSIMSGNSSMKKYVRLDIKDYDNSYVSGNATVSGVFYRESDSATVGTVSGTITNGKGRLPLNFNMTCTLGAQRGSGYLYTIDVTYAGETSKAMGWVESNWR